MAVDVAAVKRYAESSGSGEVIQDYDVSGSVSFEKGIFLAYTDGRGAVAPSAIGQACAGISAREKVSGSGRTRMALYKKGYFDVTASGSIGLGSPVILAGHQNYVMSGGLAATTGTYSGASVLGYAEEAATDEEVFILRLDL